jgi:2-methylisocitrate lyase-like PEP mutase family enzyme
MGLAGAAFTVNELAALGVKRISVGGSLARASFAVVKAAAEEMAGPGTFTFSARAIPDGELNAFMAGERGER